MTTDPEPLQCDLIMKGGITSGIVYPKAIHELSKHYRLRSIGGASAGAIAAAVAAAAEFGRRDKGSDRFAELGELPQELGAAGPDGMTQMLTLFKPDPKTHNAFHWLLSFLDSKRAATDVGSYVWRALRLTGSAMRYFPAYALLGLLLAGAVFYGARGIFLHGNGLDWLTGLITAAAALLTGAAVTLAGALGQTLRAIAANGYGLVSGMHANADTLTSWLHQKIQSLAGLPNEKPLTFGDLWGKSDCAPHKREIDLRMMTSCLSLGQGLCFPLEPNEKFYYNEAELGRYFPAELMKWMREHPRPLVKDDPAFDAELKKHNLLRLPTMAELPILLAVRMSLSFPLLLSAIPLWNRRFKVGGSYQLQRCWFSDGGLISNFPIHFFDALIPTRPTFGIDLIDADVLGLPANSTNPDDFVSLPRKFDVLRPIASQIEEDGQPKLMRFVAALLGTLHGWSDRAQQRVPGFKERVVSIALREGEGGLNLRMPKALIDALAERGLAAGKRLVLHYHPSQSLQRDDTNNADIRTTWSNHRWVRYRTAGHLLEEALESVLVGDEKTKGTKDDLRDAHQAQGAYQFYDEHGYRDDLRRKAALETYLDLIELAIKLRAHRETIKRESNNVSTTKADRIPGDDGIYGVNYPKPRSRLRIMPRD